MRALQRLSRLLKAEQYGVLGSGIAVDLGLGYGCKLVPGTGVSEERWFLIRLEDWWRHAYRALSKPYPFEAHLASRGSADEPRDSSDARGL